ncbi:MAG: hypothetical protein ACOYM7_07025, partial [Paludibacter sp.]
FNLKTIRKSGSTSVDLVIHTTEFDYVSADKTYNLTYKYGTSASTAPEQKIKIPAKKARIN